MSEFRQIFNPISGKFDFVNEDGILFFQTSVATFSNLPITGNTKNDARFTDNNGHLYIWSIKSSSGSLLDWIDQGQIITPGGGGSGIWGGITGTLSDQTDLQSALDAKSNTLHNHDSRYYTESETDTLLAAKLNIADLNYYDSTDFTADFATKNLDDLTDGAIYKRSHNDFTDTLLSKLNGIANNANNYSLPIATSVFLGGVKIGNRITITAGVISADVQSDENFTSALKNKLDGIESLADVTDVTNVTTALNSINVNALSDITSVGADIESAVTLKHDGGTQDTAIGLNTAHRGSDGSDHSFINQSVVSAATPVFGIDNFTDGGGLVLITSTQETNFETAYSHSQIVMGNPHSVTKSDLSLDNVDNVQQMPLSYLDTDTNLAQNSDVKTPSQKAVKTYIDTLLAANDAMVYKGAIDANANPNYPAADAGHTYRISAAGKIGGTSGINVEIGDLILCTVDSTASGDQATVGNNWDIIQTNLDGAAIGAASSVDNNLVAFDGVTGKLLKDSSITTTNVNSAIGHSQIVMGNPHSVTKSDLSLDNVDNVATDDTAYDATTWNNNTDAATKNVIRDKIETMDTAIGLNTAKNTNVSTQLSAGTITSTTYGITSDGGVDDLVLPEADTTNAGLLGADKWDEIVVNSAHAADNTQAHSDYLINNGNDSTTGIITSAGLVLGTDKKLQLRDSAIYISSKDDGHLDFDADTSIDLNADTVITGDVDISGKLEYDGSDTNPVNLLLNGNFESWSAGTAVAPDGWESIEGATISQESTIIKTGIGQYSAKIISDSDGSRILFSSFSAESFNLTIRGKTLTFSCWTYATEANVCRLGVYNGASWSYSSYHTGDSTWQLLIMTVTMTTNTTNSQISVFVDGNTKTSYATGAMLVEGSTPFAFTPHINDFLYRDNLIVSDYKLQLRDSAIYISSKDDGHLDFDADTSVDVNTNLNVYNATFTGKYGCYIDERASLLVSGKQVYHSMQLSTTYNSAIHPNYGLVLVNGASTSDFDVWGIMHDGPAKANGGLKFAYLHGIGSGANVHTQTPMVTFQKSGRVGIGLTPTANMNGLSIEAGVMTIKETTTPTADTNYGKVYTKNDNKLYFQDGAGTEHEIAYV